MPGVGELARPSEAKYLGSGGWMRTGMMAGTGGCESRPEGEASVSGRTKNIRRRSILFPALWGAGLACVVMLTAACDKASNAGEFIQTVPLEATIDASDVLILDLRMPQGSIEIEQAEGDTIEISGMLDVTCSDEATGRLKASKAGVEWTEGRVCIVTLPDPGEEATYEIDLLIKIPRNVNLRILLESGPIEANIELPAKVDCQVGSGSVYFSIPRSTSARIDAKTNSGNISIEGFETMSGKVRRQLMYADFDGSIGRQGGLGGKRLEVHVNRGEIVIEAREEEDDVEGSESPQPNPVPVVARDAGTQGVGSDGSASPAAPAAAARSAGDPQ